MRPSALIKTIALFGTIAGTAAALFTASHFLNRETIEDVNEDDFLDVPSEKPKEKVRAFDFDKDGEPDGFAADTTGDGNIDTVTLDTDGDGEVDTALVDTTGDGELDTKVDLKTGETSEIKLDDSPENL